MFAASDWTTNPFVMVPLMIITTPIALGLLYFVTGPHKKGPKK